MTHSLPPFTSCFPEFFERKLLPREKLTIPEKRANHQKNQTKTDQNDKHRTKASCIYEIIQLSVPYKYCRTVFFTIQGMQKTGTSHF